MIRREVGRLSSLVTASGYSKGHIATVGDHIDSIINLIFATHRYKAEVIWPKLLSRSRENLEPLLASLTTQHRSVESTLRQCWPAARRWRRSPAERQRYDLILHLRSVAAVTKSGLAREDIDLVPLVVRELSTDENDDFADRVLHPDPEVSAPVAFEAPGTPPRSATRSR
ncbi:hypothetical protein AB0J83_35750 [Actinoplanes sp. NPDC049596]|uniref:hypothetical protein n=1 Tax=unclassified Actinoplanes TaxID=2626549 RepID=UPI003417C7F6